MANTRTIVVDFSTSTFTTGDTFTIQSLAGGSLLTAVTGIAFESFPYTWNNVSDSATKIKVISESGICGSGIEASISL